MHLLPGLFLLAAVGFAFRQTLFFGYRFVGNADRLSQYLSFILFHTHYLARGQFSAWSDNLYDGFDILSLPMSFVTPLFAIPALLHTDDVVAVFGIITPALFAITLLEAYLVAHVLTHDRLAAVAAACTYGCATYGLLKLAQSDQTYLSILTAPAFFYLVHTTRRSNWLSRFVALTVLVAIECYFAFLQEFSYNVIFFFIYSLVLLLRRNAYPVVVFSAAMLSGALLSAPRLLVQVATVAASGRTRSAPVVAADDAVGLRTLMRFFSRDIFGHTWTQNQLLPSSMRINLEEGDLVHSSVFGALLLVVIVLSCTWVFTVRNRTGQRTYLAGVLVLYSVVAFAVMHNTDAYLLLSRLYQNVSFQHGRIGVSALLPIALLTGLFLASRRGPLGPRQLFVVTAVSAVIIVISALDFGRIEDWTGAQLGLPTPLFTSCDTCLPGVQTGPVLTADLLRFVVLASLFVAVLIGGLLTGTAGRSAMKTVFAVAIVFQTVWGAADYLEGSQTRDFVVPYEANNFVVASPDEFVPPDPLELDRVHALLDNDNYRSVTICPSSFSQSNCSTTVALTWDLRLVDGYLSGVPQRLASLPWRSVGSHEIRFQSDDLPWTILSFLNTRQAIRMTREFYMNVQGMDLERSLQLVANPSPYVYPRAYFADMVRSVDTKTAEAAVRQELGTCPPACDNGLRYRFPVDYVEGPPAGTFDPSGSVTWSGGGDRLTFDFPASPRDRFLVVNEMWDLGWTAEIQGHTATVYPTNVTMRGLVIPAGTTEVVLEYRSFLYWVWWYVPALVAAGAIVIFVARRRGWHAPSW
jgi:hypothetical protein